MLFGLRAMTESRFTQRTSTGCGFTYIIKTKFACSYLTTTSSKRKLYSITQVYMYNVFIILLSKYNFFI